MLLLLGIIGTSVVVLGIVRSYRRHKEFARYYDLAFNEPLVPSMKFKKGR